MFARSTTFHGDPQRMDEGISYVRDEVMPAVTAMSGCVGLSMLCDRGDGRCIVTTAWADEAAMHMTESDVQDMRQRMSAILGGGGHEVAEWEIGLLHRMHEAPEGACTRLTWTRGDPAEADRMLDTFRMAMLPRVEELPGFCSLSLLLDRNDGRGVVASTYDSREQLRRSADAVREMREQFTRELGMEVTDMAEMDLEIAHLRVPETV